MEDKTTRKNRLMPNNTPRWIRCYDNGGKTWDRYTVVYTKKHWYDDGRVYSFGYVGMSSNPFAPQGFGQHGESNFQPIDRPSYGHLGKKITFAELPEDCQKLVREDYMELWNLE